jgi:hypothetical protein
MEEKSSADDKITVLLMLQCVNPRFTSVSSRLETERGAPKKKSREAPALTTTKGGLEGKSSADDILKPSANAAVRQHPLLSPGV